MAVEANGGYPLLEQSQVAVCDATSATRSVTFALSDIDVAPRQLQPRRSGPARWPAPSTKAVHARHAHARGKAEAWHAGVGSESMTEDDYITCMLGGPLVTLLREAGLLCEPATVSDLLDEQVSIEDFECYIGNDARWPTYRSALMRFGVPLERELL